MRIYEGKFNRQQWDHEKKMWVDTHTHGCQVYVLAEDEWEADQKIKNVVEKMHEKFGGEYRGIIYNSPLAVDGVAVMYYCNELSSIDSVKL